VADILGGNKFLYNSASPGTFTLPTSSLVDGMVVNVAQIGAGALTVSGGTIVGTTVTTAQYQGLSFVYVASGTTWYSVAPAATAPGLAIVTPTSIANSGGSASASGGQVTFSGVTAVSLNGVFTSTYSNYLVMFRSVPSTTSYTQMRFRLSGTDTTSSYQNTIIFNTLGSAPAGAGGGTSTIQISTNGSGENSNRIDVFSPNLPNITILTSNAFNSAGEQVITSGSQNGTTQFDGFTLYQNTGTINGTIRVYGYRNS
jgi:hypothetical protein